MLQLTSTDKKLLKQITSFPWPEGLPPARTEPVGAASDEELDHLLNGNAPLEVQLQAAVEQFNRIAHLQLANLAPLYPQVSESVLRRWLSDTCLYLNRIGEAGIARRFLTDDSEELVRFGVIGARMQWVVSGHGHSDAAGMWGEVLCAIAIGDDLLLNRLLATLPTTLREDQAYPYPPYYVGLYHAVLSMVRGELDTARPHLEQLRSCRMPENEAAIVTCLLGIVEHSPQLVAEGLEVRAVTIRKVKAIDPHYKLFDGMLHCLYQFCRRFDPELTHLWDTGHRLPWDAEYHELLQAGGDPMRTVDLSGLPEGQRSLLTELPIPDWWSALS